MTLEDYARVYTFRAASLTMARHISPRLVSRESGAANENRLCPVEGCVWPAGSACTMSGCPGRAFKKTRAPFSPLVLPRTEPREAVPNRAASHLCLIDPHTSQHSEART